MQKQLLAVTCFRQKFPSYMSDKVPRTPLFFPARLNYKFAVCNKGKFRSDKKDTRTNRWKNHNLNQKKNYFGRNN